MSSIVRECKLSIDKQKNDRRKKEKDVANFVLSCVSNGSLIGLPSNSASPTDQWLVKFEPNTLYTYENTSLNITDGFMKVFITSPLLNNYKSARDTLSALRQEIKIYKSIQSIMQNQINGHFVRYLISVDGSETLTIGNLWNFLYEKINKDKVRENLGISKENEEVNKDYIDSRIDDNYWRNIASIFASMNKEYFARINTPESKLILELIGRRPAIQNYLHVYDNLIDTMKKISIDKTYLIENLRFGFIVTESVKIDDSKHYDQLPPNYSRTLENLTDELIDHSKKGNLDNVKELINIILTAYFQVATACYSLFVNGISHNDLHTGNIWVKTLSQNEQIYYKLSFDMGSGNEPLTYYYEVNSNRFSMLYDWDRSYKKWNRNDLIKEDWSTSANQSNDCIEQRDFVKSLCYFIRAITSLLKENDDYIKAGKYPLLLDEIKEMLRVTVFKILEIITKDDDTKKLKKSLKDLGLTDTDIKNIENESKSSGLRMAMIFWLNVYNSKNKRGKCFLNYDLQNGKYTGFIDKDIYDLTLDSMPLIIHNWHHLLLGGNRFDNIDESRKVFNIGSNISFKEKIIKKIFNVSGISSIDKDINLYKTIDVNTLLKSTVGKVTGKASAFFSNVYSSVKYKLGSVTEERKEEILYEQDDEKESFSNPYESQGSKESEENSLSKFYGINPKSK